MPKRNRIPKGKSPFIVGNKEEFGIEAELLQSFRE
jgi:hypothetical protein